MGPSLFILRVDYVACFGEQLSLFVNNINLFMVANPLKRMAMPAEALCERIGIYWVSQPYYAYYYVNTS